MAAAAPLPWLEAFAHARGLRYEPEADERWLRAWEPYATVRVPFRYEHVLSATGSYGSLSLARAVLELPGPFEVGTWLAIVQDERLHTRAATTSDFGSPFAEPLELVPLRRRTTGEPTFDNVFASFAESGDALVSAITPSLRRLLLSWRAPVHAEIRPGGFILTPVSAPPDGRGLSWVLDAVHLFGEKANKQAR
jgi:hypothetical protein